MAIVGIFSLILGIVFYFLWKKKAAEPRLQAAEKLRALAVSSQGSSEGGGKVERLGPGGVVRFENVGLTSESMDAEVAAKHLHKAGSSRWIEWELDRGAHQKLYLTLEDGELSLTTRTLELRDLGLSRQDIEQLESRTIDFEGTSYHLDSRGEATYCPEGNELETETYRYWEFEGEEGQQYLSVVQWADLSIEAYYSVPLELHQVMVFREVA